ncbi:hypothetical protein PGTUg99_013695 [Puccinia graminis f. sp. tritici]|uniref:CAP-Gly domain-containing protein n=1 Tax=Puccinia graminis f. sp. tritici TaxID=56615 RepID=A0A5B0RHZ1_PUCGR|nr:hypothetical protein PGTUg99_013695 [Puccinia graminis f. sp. tritici]
MKNSKLKTIATTTTTTTPQRTTTTNQPSSSSSFGVGDRVKCSNSMVGICRFIGTIESKPGIWVGIDLGQDQENENDPLQPSWHGKGKNSGSVNGVVYFQCQPLCGIFFPISKVSAYHQPSSTTSLTFPLSPTSRQSVDFSSTDSNQQLSSSPSRARRQSALPASTNNNTTNTTTIAATTAATTPISNSNSSTPRPRPRPSLPARSTAISRKPSLPPMPDSKALNSSTSSSATINKTHSLTRKSSSIKPTDNPSSTNSTNFLDRLPPLPPTFDPSSKKFSPFNSKSATNPFSKSINGPKRSSVSHIPPSNCNNINNSSCSSNTTTIRPTSRTSLKRPESVNSHYARAATPEWARQSRQRRPTSRLSLISNSESKSSKNPSICSIDQFVPPELPSTSPEQVIQIQQRIIELENLVEQNKLQHSELENQHLQKSKELERELESSKESLKQAEEDKLVQLEKLKEELNQNNQLELNRFQEQLTNLNESLRLSQEASTQQSLQFEKEKAELQSQLNQLRSAGQSLCGVYENKISDLEALRLDQLHQSELIAEELKTTKLTLEELQKAHLNQTEINKSSLSRSTSSPNHLEAVEIDNESLKADLKYTQEQLSEVQDEAYQLKQELANERELREQLSETHDQSLQQHILSVKAAREEAAMLDKEKLSLQFKLTQAETRLKETLETMEQERVELEGLRAEILASSSHPHPSQLSPRLGRSENNDNATVTNTATGGGSERSIQVSKSSSNFRHDQLESELKEKQSRIEFLEAQLNRNSFPEQSKPSLDTTNQTDSQPIMDQEKMLVIQKYQRLLLIKDEENLKLISKLEELEEQLELHPKSRFHNLSPARGATIGHEHSSPRLRHKTSTQSLWRDESFNRSPRPGVMSRSISCKEVDESNAAKELTKANQQIIGLKLIARQSDDERAKFEKANLELKQEIEELKQDNRLLEQKLAQLIKSGQLKIGSNRIRSETIGLSRKYSVQELGIENEIGLLSEISNQQKPSGPASSTTTTTTTMTNNEGDHRPHQLQTGEVIIGDYKKVKKLELEIDQLKSQLAFLEQKHGREVAALNKEVSELESIIESKIFQEEELEEEIKRLNERLIQSSPVRAHERPQSMIGGSPGTELQRRGTKVWRRRTLELGQQAALLPATGASLAPSGRASKRFSALSGLQEAGQERPGFDEFVDDRRFYADATLVEEEEPDEDRPESEPAASAPELARTRMIVTDHDADDHHNHNDLACVGDQGSGKSLQTQRVYFPSVDNPVNDDDLTDNHHLTEEDDDHIHQQRGQTRSLASPDNNNNNNIDNDDEDDEDDEDNEPCELCDQHGHQLETCPIFSVDS